LIDKLALRVGNEKSDEEADTVGCCSLRKEHIKLEEDNRITFDFLGKDSMRYFNTVEVIPIVYENIKTFLQHKKPEDDLFDRIDAPVLNDYLKSQMEGLTAKVFRTYNASITL
jgi:DNA topoisomerase-1